MNSLRSLVLAGPWFVILAACSPAARHDDDSAKSRGTESAATTSTVSTPARLVATATGIGPVHIGASWQEVSHALGNSLPSPRVSDAGCFYAAWPGGPARMFMMFEAGHLVRIDVANAAVPTGEGVRIGDSEADVLSRYGKRATVSPQKYTPGHSISVTPSAAADSNYRIVFETDSGRVARYHVGRLPAVEYVEACG